ncbi:MAG: DUF1499 domain-containing protein [Nitrospirae bacterium]|nr:DUF1499 domain-containing protein [Candidatus Manganitrophaceae bacterium]
MSNPPMKVDAGRPTAWTYFAQVGFLLALLALFTAIGAGFGARFERWHFRTGFSLLQYGALGGAAAAVISLIALVGLRRRGTRGEMTIALLGFAIGITIFAIPLQWMMTARQVPPIHDITTDPPDQAFDKALAAARSSGWKLVDARKEEGRIEATDTTFWFGFKDDIVVRITPADPGSRIDVRSVSRVGKSDVGTNARRIQKYLRKLEKS